MRRHKKGKYLIPVLLLQIVPAVVLAGGQIKAAEELCAGKVSDEPTVLVTGVASDEPLISDTSLSIVAKDRNWKISSIAVFEIKEDSRRLLQRASKNDFTWVASRGRAELQLPLKLSTEARPGTIDVHLEGGRHSLEVDAIDEQGHCGYDTASFEVGGVSVFAVVIGINDYKSVSSLNYAVSDATRFYQHLRGVLKIPEGNIRFLTEKDATQRNIAIASDWLHDQLHSSSQNSTVIWYFAGHGYTASSNPELAASGYLVPQDGLLKFPRTLINQGQLNDDLIGLKARRTVVFIDACFASAGVGSRGLGTVSSSSMRAASGGTDLWAKFSGIYGIYSSGTSQPSWEDPKLGGSGSGVFTHFLLEAFHRAGTPDKPGVTLDGAFKYVHDKVVEHTTKYFSKTQEPGKWEPAPPDANKIEGMPFGYLDR